MQYHSWEDPTSSKKQSAILLIKNKSACISPKGLCSCHWCDGWQQCLKLYYNYKIWSILGTVKIQHQFLKWFIHSSLLQLLFFCSHSNLTNARINQFFLQWWPKNDALLDHLSFVQPVLIPGRHCHICAWRMISWQILIWVNCFNFVHQRSSRCQVIGEWIKSNKSVSKSHSATHRHQQSSRGVGGWDSGLVRKSSLSLNQDVHNIKKKRINWKHIYSAGLRRISTHQPLI